MKVTINLDTGLLIESQCDEASDDALLANATSTGYVHAEVRQITDAELRALIAARTEAQKTPETRAAEKDAVIKQAKALRETILNRLTGIQVNTINQTEIDAIKAARQSLLDFPTNPAVIAATDGATTKTAVLAVWYATAAALTAAAQPAASAFTGMGME